MSIKQYKGLFSGYTELRLQENHITQITLLKGNPVTNSRTCAGGASARVYRGGSWGFASAPSQESGAVRSVIKNAADNAAFLDSMKNYGRAPLPSRPGTVSKRYDSAREYSQRDYMDFLRTLDDYIVNKYPDLLSRSLMFHQLAIEKQIVTSDDSLVDTMIPRSLIMLNMSVERDGAPVSLYESLGGGLGMFDAQFTTPEALFAAVDRNYEELRRKKDGIYAEKGMSECVLDADLAGILAHEALGHTVEADFVLSGSVARNFPGKRVAPECVTLVDFAHTAEGETCPTPVFVDDEGVLARDAYVIRDGVLESFLHNRESAAQFDTEPTGNGRAYRFSDEPLIRMRNTAFARGKDKLRDMIASVENGYYLANPGNGQADATSEFMFAVTRGYEIKNGKLGRALLDTTISGVAFDLLKTISMVSDDFKWVSSGMCGKKQPINVGMGGPAIKCEINIG